ncbi:MAG: FAD-dependent monooxygenase, partial [Geminicoccales bacterium]
MPSASSFSRALLVRSFWRVAQSPLSVPSMTYFMAASSLGPASGHHSSRFAAGALGRARRLCYLGPYARKRPNPNRRRMAQPKTETATCCIVGGGPAGAVLGLLLARNGLDVTMLEKHHDFLRDFRGDTIHASTIQLMEELGLAERFLELPHQVASTLEGIVEGQRIVVADFSALGGRYPHILFMPQWDFLDFVTSEAGRYPGFRLLMDAEATDIIRDGDRVAGVSFRSDGRERVIRAALTVACDGRESVLRERAGLVP